MANELRCAGWEDTGQDGEFKSIEKCWAWVDSNYRPSRFTSSGRSNQPFDPLAAFHSLDLALAGGRFGTRCESLGVNKVPRSTILDGGRPIVVVFKNALDQMFGVTDIIAPRDLTLQNVHME
jgi:hypothetical protein